MGKDKKCVWGTRKRKLNSIKNKWFLAPEAQ